MLVRPALLLLLCLGWGEVCAADLPPMEVQSWDRVQHLNPPGVGRDGFVLKSPAVTGIHFTNRLSMDRALTNQIFLNGSGVAAGDVDGDGWCDLYFCGLDGPNALYRNRGGWRFEDVTGPAGVGCEEQASTGCALADVDGDGDLDLLVNGIASGTRLFLNDGRARFREVTDEAGLRGKEGGASLALADVDGDGDLDLYVVNYRNDTMRDMPELQFNVRVTNGVYQLIDVNGQPATHPQWMGRFTFDRVSGVLENGQADTLWRNQGGGRFERVPWESGAFLDESGGTISAPMDWGLSAQFRDLNGDGFPDLYVCNDFHSPDRIWMNDGRGVFRAMAKNGMRQTSLFSMGVDGADVNRDGYVDLFIADMLSPDHRRRLVQVMDATAFAQSRAVQLDRPQTPRNTLQVGRGRGVFDEMAQMAGVEASDWSWCPVFLDVDLDGFEDLLVTTGHARDAQNMDTVQEMEQIKARGGIPKGAELELRRRFAPLRTPNVVFRNLHDLRFENMSAAWGFDAEAISHGMGSADLDNDGDLDVVVNTLNEAPLIYENGTAKPRVAVRLRGAGANTQGIGARMQVRCEGSEVKGWPEQSQEMLAGGRYLSGDAGERVFALPSGEAKATIEVIWRSGKTTVITGAKAGHRYEIHEKAGVLDAKRGESGPTGGSKSVTRGWGEGPLWEDVSGAWAPVHEDGSASDLVLQPLVPHGTLAHGPGVSWMDINGDERPDLLMSGGQGGRLAVYRNPAQGGFVRQKSRLFEQPLEQPMISVVGVMASEPWLFQVMGARRGADPKPALLRTLSLTSGTMQDLPLPVGCNPGTVAWADMDGDGDLDLFVGARSPDGQYPGAGPSVLFRNTKGTWVPEREAFPVGGPVNDAVWAHLSGGPLPELVLVGDYGPVRLFRKGDAGRAWSVWDPNVKGLPGFGGGIARLSDATGWWTSVAVGDWDGDGRLDLILGNWGRNHRRHRYATRPLEMHAGDLSGSGVWALMEGVVDPYGGQRVPLQDLNMLKASFPMLQERFPSLASFAAVDLDQVLGGGMPPLEKRTAAVLDSGVLLQRGDGQPWEWLSLPWEAQASPIQGMGVADWDGDGSLDVVLSQNFHDVASGESRADAGRGLVLLGTGKGAFEAVSMWESGLEMEGEGRGVAISDWDRDGRPDVAMAQYRGGLKLFRNRSVREMFGVVLRGRMENGWGVGARVNGRYTGGKKGPVLECVLGTGQKLGLMGEVWVARSLAGAALEAVEVMWSDGVQVEVREGLGGKRVEVRERR